MPRLRRATLSSEFPKAESRLQSIDPSPRSVQDSETFFRAIVELERVRGLRVHPGSPTLH